MMLDYEMDDMHTVTVTASDGEDSDSIDRNRHGHRHVPRLRDAGR